MFTKPLDPLSGRNAKFTSSQDSILKIAYLKSTRRLPNNRGLVCMWSNFHKEVQRSEEFKGEEIKDSYLHEQRATVLGSQTSLINFEMLDELPFTKPLTRSWDPPNFFGSTPADDARNPFYKCSYKGKEVYNNDYGEEEEMGNKRLRLESSTATPPLPPPPRPIPVKAKPLPDSSWSSKPFTLEADDSILSTINKPGTRKPCGAIRWVIIFNRLSSLASNYGTQSLVLRYNQLISLKSTSKILKSIDPKRPLSIGMRIIAMWVTDEYDSSDKFYGQYCQGWIHSTKVGLGGRRQHLIHFNDDEENTCKKGVQCNCMYTQQWVDDCLVLDWNSGMEEMIVIANNKKLIGVNMVWNGWERHWMTDKTGDAVFRSILKAERTYDECYVREVGKKVKSRAMNLPLDWEDLKERPRRIQFKDDVVRELLPETNAVEEEKREEEVEKK